MYQSLNKSWGFKIFSNQLGKPERATHKNLMNNGYIAGFLDGEGYFGIRKHKHNELIRDISYQVVIKAAQRVKDRKVLDLIKDKYGGHVSKPRHHGKNQQDSVMWEISNPKIIQEILNDIEEYSLVKKPQIKVMRKFISVGNMRKGGSKGFNKEANDIIQNKRMRLYEEIKILNHRGLAETE